MLILSSASLRDITETTTAFPGEGGGSNLTDSLVLHFWVWHVSELVLSLLLCHVSCLMFYLIGCCGLEHPHSRFVLHPHTSVAFWFLLPSSAHQRVLPFFARFLVSMPVWKDMLHFSLTASSLDHAVTTPSTRSGSKPIPQKPPCHEAQATVGARGSELELIA